MQTMTNPVDILRNLVDKEITITYKNGMTVTGKLYTFHLGQGIIVITSEKDDIFIIMSSIRSLCKKKK